jgi:hypothetical protein
LNLLLYHLFSVVWTLKVLVYFSTEISY